MLNKIEGTSGVLAVEIAKQIALGAGSLLVDRFNEIKEISVKGRGNIVTNVDLEVEGYILTKLKEEFPSMRFMGEESEKEKSNISDGYVWIVDPLDGTRNYVSGIPFFSVVVGLALDGDVLLGVNYDPMRKEMFHAARGKGAFLNDRPIAVSRKTKMEDGVLGTDMSYDDGGAGKGLGLVRSLWPGMQTVRIMGSSALGLSYAAAGRYDLYFHHQLEPWDQVAGMILVEEAGGVITDRVGRRAGLHSDGLIASNKILHEDFIRKTDDMQWRRPS